jgi:hypothetical protein
MEVGRSNHLCDMSHFFRSALNQFFPYPTWVLATIEYGRNQDLILKDLLINGERKPLREKSMMSEDHRMNALEK